MRQSSWNIHPAAFSTLFLSQKLFLSEHFLLANRTNLKLENFNRVSDVLHVTLRDRDVHDLFTDPFPQLSTVVFQNC